MQTYLTVVYYIRVSALLCILYKEKKYDIPS